PEDLIAVRAWWAAKKRLAKKWIDVFPDDLSFFGDLEEASEGRLGNQGIAVWQPLRAAHARGEEVPSRLVLILPHDRVGGRIDLDCSRIGHGVVETMRSVVMRTLPFSNSVGGCWPATVGGPSFHTIFPVLREIRITVEVGR